MGLAWCASPEENLRAHLYLEDMQTIIGRLRYNPSEFVPLSRRDVLRGLL